MTNITEYRNLIIAHAELRALRIRLCATGTPADADLETRASGLMAMAMQEADAASALTPREIEILAQGLRYSIGELMSMPKESHAEKMARYRAAALNLRRMIDEGE
ncbi:hypothetical protein [Streptomyces marianii]|uniref:Uncharacterized protein n=1 Tax=Streptomyces marianii TaxID=1817406 RepID=A0A5R9DTL4_9ACTN|nr:hypothetical protein [Streptomyces marianii]TLQ39455.1 hypothetical protein FEF34_39495 [Streptomyces marianii]